jgi:ankyrin repeat protein
LLAAADYEELMRDAGVPAAEKAAIRADFEADLNMVRNTDINAKATALHYAATHLKADIVKRLLELGADPNAPILPVDPSYTLYHNLHELLKVLKAKKMDAKLKTLINILVMLHEAGGKLTDELMAEPELMSHMAWMRRKAAVVGHERAWASRGRRMRGNRRTRRSHRRATRKSRK